MSEIVEDTTPVMEKYKRKRKKSFLKNARKYGKKGCYGRGTQLDADTYQYFIRIMEVFKEGFDTDEDKGVFVNNVFEQTVDNEVDCCCNQVGCRVIETLLPFANDEVLQRFMGAFGDKLRPLCCDRFASHVLEALIKETGKAAKAKHRDFLTKVSKFLLNNLEDFLWDTYSSHVIRTCLDTLALVQEESFLSIIKEYGERILHWPQFNELCHSDVTSGFLQCLLKVLRQVDKKTLKKVLNKLMEDNFTDTDPPGENKLPNIFFSQPAMLVLEAALEVAKSKNYSKIYARCFAGRLVKLATTRSTNFAVQKLISNCKQKNEFEAIFDELEGSFTLILDAGHTGIIWALAKGCKFFTTKQGSLVQNVMKALLCFQPEEAQNNIVPCLCKFKSIENVNLNEFQKDKLNLHGTLIIQLMLEFNKPIKIVSSILNMDNNVLKGLFSNPMGSHIVDSYVKSSFVGEKSREKLIRKMKGTYQELASNKYGSRSFEALWNAAGLKNRTIIMEELSYKDGSWCNSEHGKIIAHKIGLVLFKRNKEEWRGSMNASNKAEVLFADILK